MYTNRVILKLKRLHPSVQRYAILNNWSPSRNINLLQRCKDCLNSLMKGSQGQDPSCQVTESCCSARAPLENAGLSHEIPPNVATQQQSTSVIVIGAGMAGLSTANHLQENGVTNITVLEATDRPGGRIQSRWFGDSIIELGSPIDKDPAVHPIVKTVIEDGFTTYQLNSADLSRGLLMRSDGNVIPYPLAFDVYQIFKKIWQEVHDIEYEQSGQGKESTMTLLGSRIQQEARMFPSKYQHEANRVFHGLASLTLSKSNHDNSLITSNSFGDYLQMPGSNVLVPLGHFGEINTLYEAIPKDKILFNKTVSKIRWGGVADVFPRAVVICEDGESFQADYVIITIPLGVLKALADTLFCPGLPSRKLNAVLKIPMGFANKVFLEFPEPFWKWKKDFQKISYEAKKMLCKEGWLKGVCSIEPLRGSNNVVCVTVAGLEAQCMECLPDKDIIYGVVSLLKESSPNENIPEPVKIKRTSWSSDPNFYGAYSSVDSKVCSQDFYDLATPLPELSELCDPVLLFAGEATCPVQFGTVRGAKNSGIREAERLLQLLRLQNEKEPYEVMKMGCGF